MPLYHYRGPSVTQNASLVRAATRAAAAALLLEADPWLANDYGGRLVPTAEVIRAMILQDHLRELQTEGPPAMLMQGHDAGETLRYCIVQADRLSLGETQVSPVAEELYATPPCRTAAGRR